MLLWQNIKNFYNQYATKEDRVILSLTGLTLFLGALYILINHLFFHFTGNTYTTPIWLKFIPIMLPLLVLGMYARQISPRMGYLTRSYAIYFFLTLAISLLTTGIQYTPFPRIDQHLAHIDQILGFNQIALLNWTYAHPFLKNLFSYAYNSIAYELFLVPLLISALMDKKGYETYLLVIALSFLIGSTLYYFLPTAGPTAVFHSKHFLAAQHDTLLKFKDVHHHLPLTTFEGGMIAFPSFHVTWAILLVYATRHKKWLFYPLAAWNLIVASATIFLGWHYLTDVIAAIVLSATVIYLAEKIYHGIYLNEKRIIASKITFTKPFKSKSLINHI